MADSATLQTRLTELEEVEHQLVMGAQVVKITRDNGDEIVFNGTRLNDVRQQMKSLKRQLGQKAGIVLTTGGC